MRVMVVGSLSLDRLVQDGRESRRVGGTVTYSGLTWSRLGAEVVVVTGVAARDRGALVPLARAGILAVAGDTDQTTSFVNRVAGDRRDQELAARARPIPADLVAAAGPADLLHLGPLHPDDLAPGVWTVAARLAPAVAVDIQGLTRRVEEPPPGAGPGGGRVVPGLAGDAPGRLAGVRCLKGDAIEVATLAAGLACRPDQVADVLEAEEVLCSRASLGGQVLRRGLPPVAWSAVEVAGNPDPTGAGDVFLAAYLWARLAGGRSVAEAAGEAARVAARQVAGDWIRPDELALG